MEGQKRRSCLKSSTLDIVAEEDFPMCLVTCHWSCGKKHIPYGIQRLVEWQWRNQNGVFETVRLRKAGFANRMTLDRFINKNYACLGNNERTKEGVSKFLREF